MDDNGKGLRAEYRKDVQARPKRRATDGLSPRRPRKAERVFVTYRQLNRLEATRYLLTSSHDLPQWTARRARQITARTYKIPSVIDNVHSACPHRALKSRAPMRLRL